MTAATGLQGYRKARDSQPDAIVLDLMLPDVDGWDVCRRLKGDERTRDIPIVILTARDEPHGARRAEEAGCVAYLKKPCPPPQLVAALRRAIVGKTV
jgi:CheY-like chemotaxis protein